MWFLRQSAVALLCACASSLAQGQSRILTARGTSLMDYYGWSVSSAGDVDGDGSPDIAVGAIGAGYQAGLAQVLSGRDGSPLLFFFGASAQDLFGSALAGGRDLNGDGVPDIVAAAPREPGGKAWVYSGINGSVLYELNEPTTHSVSFFASAVSVGEDVDGNGLPDVLVSGLQLVEIYSGVDGTLIHSVPQPAPDANGFGASASFVGDLNGDGREDFAVGAPSDQSLGILRGRVYVYSGSDASLLYDVGGRRFRDQFGSFVGRAGDVDADGTPDLLVGAEQVVCCRSGYVEVLSGVDGGRIHRIDGKGALERTNSGSAIGDINSDGFDDIAIGSPGRPAPSGGFGVVELVSGEDGQVLSTLEARSDQSSYGLSIADLGDVNGDGSPDFAVGAPLTDDVVNFISDIGDMEVLSGACFAIRRYCDGGVNSIGEEAHMSVEGTTSIADGDLTLSATDLPPGKPGLFVFGTAQIQVPFGDGFRCVGGSTFRPGPFVHTSSNGRASRDFDFSSSPVTAGSTWNFQLWYRDSGPAGFNLSDALELGFCQ